ncbi:MAG: hypothetical protein M3O28_12905 [Actinomycetota bacterium]|nr:hypothetical protein [Actinomycetota bacterium]
MTDPMRRTCLTVAGLSALVLLGTSACSSKASPTAQATTPPSTAAATPAPASNATTATGASTIDAATVAAVTKTYLTFFTPGTAETVSIGLLQDGPAFKTAIEAAAKQAQAQKTSATVSAVTLQSPNTAKVVFSVLANGTVVAANQNGFAVREGGVWKVAGQTFCGLLSIQGTPPPACQLSAATVLPN